MEQDHGPIAMLDGGIGGVRRDGRPRSIRFPIRDLDVPMDVRVAEFGDPLQQFGVFVPLAERQAEPRARVDPGVPGDALLTLEDVGAQSVG